MFSVKGKVLEVNEGTYEGNAYASVKIRSNDVASNQILQYKVDVKKVDAAKLNAMLDKEVTVQCDIIKGANSTATLKVVGLL
jgi:hypothetical protein